MLFLVFRRSRVAGIALLSAVIAALVAGVMVARVAHAQVAPTRNPSLKSAPPQSASAPITYVYLRNNGDTLGIETITHSAAAISGVLLIKGQPRIEWEQAVVSGALGALNLKVFAPGGAPGAAPLQTGSVQMRGDSAFIDFMASTQRTKQAVPSKVGALPLVNASVLHAALLAAQARLKQLSALNVFLTSGAMTIAGTVAQAGDTTVFKLATSDMRILAGSDGMPSTILLPAQGARVVRATSAVSASAGRINYDAPVGAPYTSEQVRIPTGRGYELAATLTKPTLSTLAPVVITISGSGPQERDSRISIVPEYEIFRQIADTLGRRGVAVLRFDDRGVGDSGGRESAISATSGDFADDVRSIVTWLRARSDIDGSRVALAGHSEGGLIAPMVAVSDPKIRAVALLAGPAYDGRRVLMYQNKQNIDAIPGMSQRQRDSIYAKVPSQLDSAGKVTPWLGYFMAHNPLATAKLVKQPVLLLQGMTDKQITPEQVDSLATVLRASGNTDVTVRKFPATNHLFLNDPSGQPAGYAQLKDPKVRPEMLGALADWAVRVLK